MTATDLAPIQDALTQLRRRLEEAPDTFDSPTLGLVLDALHQQAEQAQDAITAALREG